MNFLPALGEKLSPDHLKFLQTFSKSCRHSIIAMLKNSQSGHPGGSLSSIDYLTLLYTGIIGKTGEKVVVSNGHISPGVYSTLAEMGWIKKEEVIRGFRKIGEVYEGHITRHIPGVWYGTGPLGIGVSVAAGFAFTEKYQKNEKKVFGFVGDGETQEGQVHEMIHFAKKYKLDNYILFVDYNKVQLTDSLEKIMPIDVVATFKAGGWHVIEVDGHNYENMWQALHEAHQGKEKPIVIVGHTIMGKGVEFMEPDGKAHKSTWHGKAPKPEDCDEILQKLEVSAEEEKLLETFRKTVEWTPSKPKFTNDLEPMPAVKIGTPIRYEADVVTDCRSAYGQALLDLAKKNTNILAMTADLGGSVMTKFVAAELPKQAIEVGISEQHMISCAGGLSLVGYVPFASTFGAFISSRAKDQARVNDINRTNVKMVSTHCGLSVGEDGPTHQAIDDMGSFLGMFHTHVIEPADPNHCDRIIRYIASHYGNFYVRMGRHKLNVLTHESGEIFFDEKYVYTYGKCELLREGTDVTIAASGPLVHETLKAREALEKKNISVEVVIVTTLKKFDDTLADSIRKTKKVLIAEDHNSLSGFGGQIANFILKKGITVEKFETVGPEEYQLSGKPLELYEAAGIGSDGIQKRVEGMV